MESKSLVTKKLELAQDGSVKTVQCCAMHCYSLQNRPPKILCLCGWACWGLSTTLCFSKSKFCWARLPGCQVFSNIRRLNIGIPYWYYWSQGCQLDCAWTGAASIWAVFGPWLVGPPQKSCTFVKMIKTNE